MTMKRLVLFTALAGLITALPAGITFAATLCVNPNGSNGCYTTISAAVSHAVAGDTVNVAPGHYAEEVTITEPINLDGVGAHGQAVIIDASGLSHAIYVSGVTGPMTISGVTAENADREGILIENSSYVTVENSTVQNNDKALVIASTNSCKHAFPFDQDDCGEGLHLRSSTYCVVQNNIVENNAGGVLLTDETGPNHDNLVTGNRVLDNVPDCGITIPSHPPCNTSVGPQPPNDANGCIPEVGTPSAGVFNNIVSGNLSMGNGAAGTGIFTPTPGTMAYGNMVVRNILEDNHQGGVVLHSHNANQDLNNNVIVGNLISGNGGDPDSEGASPPPVGIVVFSDKASNPPMKTTAAPIVGTLISHNTITNEDVDVWVGNTATNLTLMLNNLLGAGSVGVDNTGTGTVSAMDNYWGCPSGPGTGQCSNASGMVVNDPFLSQPVNKRN